MRGVQRRIGVVHGALVAWVLLAACTGVHAAEGWWNPAWRYRTRLHIEAPSTRPAAAAWARVTIPEGCHQEGRDLRIVATGGTVLSSKVVFHEPALYAVVAFALNPGAATYWAYMGNPTAEAPTDAWEPQAGVFLETRRLEGRIARSWEEYERILKDSTYAFGAGYRRQIWDGYNPYGEPDEYISLYTAFLSVPEPGEYTLCTMSDEASFLFLDGRMACQWPGYHGVGKRIEEHQTGGVRLEAGVHRLEYYHLDRAGPQAAIAGWRPPGSEEFEVIPASRFVPILAAYPAMLEERGAAVTPDLQSQQEDWCKTAGHTFTRYTFTDASSSAGGRIVERTWTFSDGTSATGGKITKTFFRTGDARVTLSVRDDRGRTARTSRPFRVHAIDKPERTSERTVANRFVNEIRDDMPQGLDRDGLVAAADLFRYSGHFGDAAALYRRAIDEAWNRTGRVEADVVVRLLELALQDGFPRGPETENYARRQLPRLPAGRAKARVYIALGRLLMADSSRTEDALASLESALLHVPKNSRQRDLEREILIALGDAHRLRGQPAEAREAYARAQALSPPAKTQAFDVSSFALTAEAYIRGGEFEEAETVLERWRNLYPLERLTGYASVLQARVLAGQNKRHAAIAELEIFLAGGGNGVFVRTALEELGDFYQEEGNSARAVELYQHVLDAFQDEEVRQRVSMKLARLGSGSSGDR